MITKRNNQGQIAKGSNLLHGLSNDPIYDCWVAMKARCTKPNHPMYKYYGARGITVCPQWADSFISFLNDMGIKPTSKYTIERIDVNKGYEPTNCTWVTIRQQQKNRTNNNQYPGVHYEKHGRKCWHTDITIDRVKHYLGRFSTAEEAYTVRQRAEKSYGV